MCADKVQNKFCLDNFLWIVFCSYDHTQPTNFNIIIYLTIIGRQKMAIYKFFSCYFVRVFINCQEENFERQSRSFLSAKMCSVHTKVQSTNYYNLHVNVSINHIQSINRRICIFCTVCSRYAACEEYTMLHVCFLCIKLPSFDCPQSSLKGQLEALLYKKKLCHASSCTVSPRLCSPDNPSRNSPPPPFFSFSLFF